MSTMTVNEKYYARRLKRYTPLQVEIAKKLYDAWKPITVFDLGCGIGGYLQGFAECGCIVEGCDIGYDLACDYMSPNVKEDTFRWDAAVPVKKKHLFDLVMSIEVAEHLDECCADNFCKNLVSLSSGLILLTAAGAGQRGKHHINCQPKSYWIDKMALLGAFVDMNETIKAIDCIDRLGDPFGITKNLMVFKV